MSSSSRLTIRNPHTRRAYARACSRFFAWCEDRGLTPATIRPHDVGTYIEQLQHVVSAPSVKQQLAAIRMLFDWLVIGQIVPNNPASAVRGPKHVVKVGKTPVLEAEAWRKLFKSIPTESVRDLRDRALIATLTYSFARINAALKMKGPSQSWGSGGHPHWRGGGVGRQGILPRNRAGGARVSRGAGPG